MKFLALALSCAVVIIAAPFLFALLYAFLVGIIGVILSYPIPAFIILVLLLWSRAKG